MRIVIDMQGVQTLFSKDRGVGRYTKELVKEVLNAPKDNEILLILNGFFNNTIEDIRFTFDGLISQKNILVWQQFYNCEALNPAFKFNKYVAEVSREFFINSLNPDIIFSTNLQEGMLESACTSVKLLPSDACWCSTLHDVTPLIYAEQYLADPAVRQWYDEKIDAVRRSDIIVTDSEYSKQQIIKYLEVPQNKVEAFHLAIDNTKFKQIFISSDERSSILNKLGVSLPFLLYTGGDDQHKNLYRLYEAFACLPPSIRESHQLVMVGEKLLHKQKKHRNKLIKLGINDHVIFTGYISDTDLIILYNLCVSFVFPSYEEGFGLPPLEAMACGAPVIASKAASLHEVVNIPEALFDPFDVKSIAEKMNMVLTDLEFRTYLKRKGLECSKKFSWNKSAQQLLGIFEKIEDKNKNKNKQLYSIPWLIEKISSHPMAINTKPDDISAIAMSLAETYPKENRRKKKLFLDVSAVIQTNDHTGIQRVTKAICVELLKIEYFGIQAEPVYTTATKDHEFYRAGSLIDNFMGLDAGTTKDEHIEFYNGDILLYLDLHPAVAINHVLNNQYYRNKGVKVYHIVYDLIPVKYPDYFWPDLCIEFKQWLKSILCSDGAICISKSVADELDDLISINRPIHKRQFNIKWFHLGSDLSNSIHTIGLPDNAEDILNKIKTRYSFTMVGTIEPRKGYIQVFEAFETLWANGCEINLVIIGKTGWKVKSFAEKIRNHPENGNHLFWLENISDEYLEMVYSLSSCLIAASFAEGFGLPLIEAARHKIPIIARDIPVFKEIAGDHAFYFENNPDPKILSDAIQSWIELYKHNEHPKSDNMPWLTWEESAKMLMDRLMEIK
jgi:glycosyltransferase involved in cell wall biosynthesis